MPSSGHLLQMLQGTLHLTLSSTGEGNRFRALLYTRRPDETQTHIQHTQVVTLLPTVQNEQSLISLMVTSGERNTKPNRGDFTAAIEVILKVDNISGG